MNIYVHWKSRILYAFTSGKLSLEKYLYYNASLLFKIMDYFYIFIVDERWKAPKKWTNTWMKHCKVSIIRSNHCRLLLTFFCIFKMKFYLAVSIVYEWIKQKSWNKVKNPNRCIIKVTIMVILLFNHWNSTNVEPRLGTSLPGVSSMIIIVWQRDHAQQHLQHSGPSGIIHCYIAKSA